MTETPNLPFSNEFQTAFNDMSVEYMSLPTGQGENPLERWDLDRPLLIFKGDTYRLHTLKTKEWELVPLKDKTGHEVLDKKGQPVMVPAGRLLMVEFGFEIQRRTSRKVKVHWRYGRKHEDAPQPVLAILERVAKT